MGEVQPVARKPDALDDQLTSQLVDSPRTARPARALQAVAGRACTVFCHGESEADGQFPGLHGLVPALGSAALVSEIHGTGAITAQRFAELQAQPVFREPAPHSLAGQYVATGHGVQYLPRCQFHRLTALGL
ncbi:hypothetical protein C5746_04760 [Streptomyces atratus]|uniref:Uncharacterized protein n=1 Tax=Streptomyces atratus TaxID=1893 RepID=A0A2Z5J7T6_STRAR|nr:hypothetical protein C5746_04760 [Streptomyces atratus]